MHTQISIYSPKNQQTLSQPKGKVLKGNQNKQDKTNTKRKTTKNKGKQAIRLPNRYNQINSHRFGKEETLHIHLIIKKRAHKKTKKMRK